MDQLNRIWESSRHNAWSWAYPTVVVLSIAAFIAIAFIKDPGSRLMLAFILVPVCTLIAGQMSAHEIAEKWRIRQEWTIQHADELTDDQQQLAFGDGGNLVFGPISSMFEALFIFILAAVVSTSCGDTIQRFVRRSGDETSTSPTDAHRSDKRGPTSETAIDGPANPFITDV